ncbi:MAG TPA: AarF/UbiB family protein [Allosphingosinicella sp.]
MNAPATSAAADDDLIATLFHLPPDAKCLPVADLAARLRDRIGPVEAGQSVITRPGHRLVARLVPAPLAALVGEFREPSLIADAVLRYSRARGEEPLEILDDAFDALATLIEGRMLVPADADGTGAPSPEPSLGAGQDFAGYEILSLVRSLDDTELYKARDPDGRTAALKIARDDRLETAAILVHEAAILDHLGGRDSPAYYGQGVEGGRAWVAMRWCDGIPIASAAQQSRASRDPASLHRLVWKLFLAYSRLHRAGVLHGDIHPGNILLGDDGRVLILDFGAAVRLGQAVNPPRGGIPHFHDPAMARAMLDLKMPPPATFASEQYALCVLAYLLVTGLFPMPGSAVQEDLLRQIAERPPLPFAERGIPAWPAAEAVLTRGLAKDPAKRFHSIAGLARAWTAAAPWRVRQPRRGRPSNGDRALNRLIEDLRTLTPSPRRGEGWGEGVLSPKLPVGARAALPNQPLHNAWLALRAGIILEDPEILAAAAILVGRAGTGWAARSLAGLVARARSDPYGETKAIKAFLAEAEKLGPKDPELLPALLAAARMLDGIAGRRVDGAPLARWAAERIDAALAAPVKSGSREAMLSAYAALALGRARAMPWPEGLEPRLDALRAARKGNIWLWSEASFAFARPLYQAMTLAMPLPADPAAQGFALLRLHQLTGGMQWVEAARKLVAPAPESPLMALLMLELKAPERAVLPWFGLAELLAD